MKTQLNTRFLQGLSRIDFWLITGLVVLAIMAFAQVATHGINGLDDRAFIDHKHVKDGLTLENINWALYTTRMAIWHPLTWWTYQTETSLFGAENNSARHLVNLALHVLTMVMSYLVTVRLFVYETVTSNYLAKVAAFFVAFLFAFHPQHVQVFAWISERKELLAALFSMLAFYAHIRGKLVIAFAWFTLSLMSKASALPMAFVIIAYDIIFNWGRTEESHNFLKLLARRWFYYLALVVMALGLALMTLKSQGQLTQVSVELGSFQLGEWFAYIVLNLGHYLKTLFLPWPLPIFVQRPETIEQTALLISIVLIVSALILLILFRKNRWVWFGAAWFVLFWLPTSGIVNIGDIYVADRYMYQAHIGAFIALFAMLLTVSSQLKSSQAVNYLGLLLLLPIFALAVYFSVLQTSYWQDNIKFYERELAINPSEKALIMLGRDHQRRGNHDDAFDYFGQILEKNPYSYYGNLYSGFLNIELENYSNAVENLMVATQQGSAGEDYFYGKAYEGLAWSYWQTGKKNLAQRLAKRGLKELPNNEYLQHFVVTKTQSKPEELNEK